MQKQEKVGEIQKSRKKQEAGHPALPLPYETEAKTRMLDSIVVSRLASPTVRCPDVQAEDMHEKKNPCTFIYLFIYFTQNGMK